jgi:hypothetical protein
LTLSTIFSRGYRFPRHAKIRDMQSGLRSFKQQTLRIAYDSVLHPFFFSIFFVLRGLYEVQLYAGVFEAIGFLFLAFLLSLATLKIFELFLRNRIKAGILASICLVIALYFGEVRNELKQHGYTEMARYRYLFGMSGVILGLAFALLMKTRWRLKNLNAFLNLISIIYILIEVFHIVAYVPQNAVSLTRDSFPIPNAHKTLPRRDIYYLVFDSYTSNSSLQEFWGFDNARITNYLRNKGFYINENAHSNYNVTTYSLASSLNMSYVTVGEDSDLNLTMRVLPLRTLIRESLVAEQLQKAGYKISNLSPFSVLNEAKFYKSTDLPDYSHALSRHLLRKTFAGTMDNDFFVRTKPETIFRIDRSLQEIIASSRNGPRFIYAHFMLPRSPFFFTKEGNVKPRSQWIVNDLTLRSAGYLDQVTFANRIIFNSIEQMENHYKPDEFPIVIIQGDHGSWVFEGQDGIRETTTIFNAYLLPEEGHRLLYNDITPVNSFRVVFNQYFSTQYKMLEDRIFEVDTSYVPRPSTTVIKK